MKTRRGRRRKCIEVVIGCKCDPFLLLLLLLSKNIFLVVVVAINRIYNVCFTSFIRLIFFEGFLFLGTVCFVGAGLWATLPPLVYLSSATTLAIDTTALLFHSSISTNFCQKTQHTQKKVITHRCQNNHLILTPSGFLYYNDFYTV